MRWTIAADHDLLLGVVQGIKRVEKLRLRPFLASDELNVVDEQDVDGAVSFAKINDAVVADRVDHFVHEALGRDVGEFEMAVVLQHVLSDPVH